MVVTFSAVGCGSQRSLVAAVLVATVVCYLFLTLVDRWGSKPTRVAGPRHLSDPSLSSSHQGLSKEPSDLTNWENEYSNRVEHVRHVCEHDEMAMMRRVWRVAANRRFGKEAFCKTRMCPIIIDEKKVLFYCFIPKVASTKVKEFFLNISGVPLDTPLKSNVTALHLAANKFLHRVSPMYYPATTARRFYKIIFVRHPFDRLVSAFRSKAEVPRHQEPYFYTAHWDKLMAKLRPNEAINNMSRITFPEFVWYLTHTLERDYDEHWAPYWSRCDPCLVDYDFVGKLETAAHDFEYAFNTVGISPPSSKFWSSVKPMDASVSRKYFSQISEKQIRDLHRIYKLDFDLFNYTLDGFVGKKEKSPQHHVKEIHL